MFGCFKCVQNARPDSVQNAKPNSVQNAKLNIMQWKESCTKKVETLFNALNPKAVFNLAQYWVECICIFYSPLNPLTQASGECMLSQCPCFCAMICMLSRCPCFCAMIRVLSQCPYFCATICVLSQAPSSLLVFELIYKTKHFGLKLMRFWYIYIFSLNHIFLAAIYSLLLS